METLTSMSYSESEIPRLTTPTDFQQTRYSLSCGKSSWRILRPLMWAFSWVMISRNGSKVSLSAVLSCYIQKRELLRERRERARIAIFYSRSSGEAGNSIYWGTRDFAYVAEIMAPGCTSATRDLSFRLLYSKPLTPLNGQSQYALKMSLQSWSKVSRGETLLSFPRK